ncbi:MAG: potassium-transporting ATPase subunit KdpA, partial [Chitinophagaceae bacterium]|nr:potassium-transporting ATPase subunit KdpA [Anaerolineae bacterium]
MNLANLIQYGLFLLIIILAVKPVGLYLYRVFEGEKTLLDPILRPVERLIYRACGIDEQSEMDWKHYALAFIAFSAVGTFTLFIILLIQSALPWYDAAHQTTPMTLDLALNTAISFSTTTTWQAYAGETTMSYLSQMVGLVAQNFLAGAGDAGFYFGSTLTAADSVDG